MSKADQPARIGSPKALKMPKGIMVLGMHRSGTSACTRVLNLLGCALPSELIPAGDGNETGHWEAVEAVNLNDTILTSAGSRWDDWGPINADWRASPLRDEMVDRAAALVSEHAKLGPLFAIKDPRLCRLADVWLAAMQQARVQPLVILMLRNPDEVAESLENRDLMTKGYGRLLWLRHVLDAEYLTRGQRRVVCTYDQLMDNWYAMIDRVKAGLGITLPRNAPAVHAEIDAFLNGQHRHHRQNPKAIIDNPALSDWLRRTYAILLAWSEAGEAPADHAELDGIRTELDRSYAAFARLLIERDVAGEVGSGSHLKRQLSARLAEADETEAAARAAVEAAEARLAEYEARQTELAAENSALHEASRGAAEEAARLAAEVERLSGEIGIVRAAAVDADALRAREAELASEIARLEQASQGAASEVARLEAEVARLAADSARADALQGELQSLREREDELGAELERLQAAAAETLRAREAELEGDIARLQQAVESAQSEIARLEADTARLAGASERADTLQDRLRAMEAEEAALRREIDRLQDDGKGAAEELARLRGRETSLSVEVAELKAALAGAREEATRERRKAEDVQRALDAGNAALDRQQQANAELKGQLAFAKSAAAQRDEELAQLWKQLLAAEKAGALAEADLARERDARRGAEQNLADAAEALEVERARHEKEREEAGKVSEQAEAEVAFLTRLLREQTEAAAGAQSDLAAANTEIAALSDKLRRIEADMRGAEAARQSAERELASRFDEAARFTLALSEDSQTKAKWLRDVVRVSERFPWWWALLPAGWRRKREHARYRRHGLFDADRYLQNNPDVAQFGMDPIRHYILHGIDEGRTWQ